MKQKPSHRLLILILSGVMFYSCKNKDAFFNTKNSKKTEENNVQINKKEHPYAIKDTESILKNAKEEFNKKQIPVKDSNTVFNKGILVNPCYKRRAPRDN